MWFPLPTPSPTQKSQTHISAPYRTPFITLSRTRKRFGTRSRLPTALTTLGPLLVIVPFALADLLAKLNIRFFAPRSLRILGMTIHTTPEGVWAALLITVLVVGIAAVFALNKRRTRKLCANFLSKSQMRFGYCLAMREELRTYQATRVPKHIENALDFWFRLLFSLEAFFAPESKQQFRPPKKGKGLAQAEKSSPKVLHPNLERLRQSFSWFRLEPQSERIVCLRFRPSLILKTWRS